MSGRAKSALGPGGPGGFGSRRCTWLEQRLALRLKTGGRGGRRALFDQDRANLTAQA